MRKVLAQKGAPLMQWPETQPTAERARQYTVQQTIEEDLRRGWAMRNKFLGQETRMIVSSVACHQCKAKEGMACRDDNGHNRAPHRSRYKEFRRLFPSYRTAKARAKFRTSRHKSRD